MATVRDFVRKNSAEAPGPAHPCDNPSLSPLEFLQAIYRDPSFPMSTRIQAASALLPYTHPAPRPVVQGPTIKIIIGGIQSEDPEQIVGISQSKSEIADNTHHPPSGDPGPFKTENDSTPPKPKPFLSTPGPSYIEHTLESLTLAQIIEITANCPEHLLPMCPCGHRMMYPCAKPCRPPSHDDSDAQVIQFPHSHPPELPA